jgi:hypothetical protein
MGTTLVGELKGGFGDETLACLSGFVAVSSHFDTEKMR